MPEPIDELEAAVLAAAGAKVGLRRAQRRLPDEAAAEAAEAAGETVHRLKDEAGAVIARVAVREEPARSQSGRRREVVVDVGGRGKVRVTLEPFLE